MNKLFLAAALICATAVADTEVVNGIAWSYTIRDGSACVVGESETAVPKTTKGALEIPAKLGGCPVTSIGRAAFYKCSSLTRVTIPDSVTSISQAAFADCTQLTDVTLPASLNSIFVGAFSGCKSLKSITIPKGVTFISGRMFSDCPSLSSVTMLSTKDTVIEAAAFLNCSSLRDLKLPSSLKYIGDKAFQNCSSLTNVHLPKTLNQIGNYAFSQCNNLVKVELSGDLPKIGKYAFSGVSPDCTIVLTQSAKEYKLAAGEWPDDEKAAEGNPSQKKAVSPSNVHVGTRQYVVIDLSGGPKADRFRVSYLDAVPKGGWTDEYKTTKLVLRRIKPGTFLMGSPKGELGRHVTKDDEDMMEPQHKVTITKPFYIGVFEVTQKQYELVTDALPLFFLETVRGDMRPVSSVSWSVIRGDQAAYNWPFSAEVSPTSFMGIIREKTGIALFDLPTEAMWEYACRAGTTSALNNGKNLTDIKSDKSVAEMGRYCFNNCGWRTNWPCDMKGGIKNGHTVVGLYKPNAWGLYDMHGNVAECCLDIWDVIKKPASEKDPLGPIDLLGMGPRVMRGGDADAWARNVRSSYRDFMYPASSSRGGGFRLCCFTEPPIKAKITGDKSQQAKKSGTRQGAKKKSLAQ